MRPARDLRATLLAATLAAAGLVLWPSGAAPARAADDALDLVTKATYTLAPKAGVVHVSVEVSARNNKPNLVRQTPTGTVTTRYFYERASIVVQREATKIRASAGGSRLTVTPHPAAGYKVVEVGFREDLFFHQSTAFRLDFDLPGGAPRSSSDIRVGLAFATYYVWAFGDRGSLRIVNPAGFEVSATGSDLASSETGGAVTYVADGITDVPNWSAVIVADRPAELTQDHIDLAGGEHLLVRAWPEDDARRTHVDDVLRKGLPALVALIGLDWPVSGDIEVDEVHTPLLEGYGGIFHVDENRIEISEDLDELTIVHEASHAWFNTALFDSRWINEGFADEYASRVLAEVSAADNAPDPVDPDSDGHVRLNAWTFPGRIADATTNAREQFGYAASWRVIRNLARNVGEDGLRLVIRAADDGQIAYAGAGTAETNAGATDWRRFLDLLQEAAGSTAAEDLFREWVVTPDEATTLDTRAAARANYAELVAAGHGWLPGIVVRQPLADWTFEAAEAQIAAARAILGSRDRIAALAGGLGVAPPASLRAAYEAATDLAPVRLLADSQLATLEALAATQAGVAAGRDPVTSIGLIGTDPAAELAAAIAAFGAGDTAGASAAAARAGAELAAAPDAGRTRIAVSGGILAGGLVLGGGSVVLLRRRRRRLEAGLAAPDAVNSYATLGAPAAEEAGQEPAAPRHEEEG